MNTLLNQACTICGTTYTSKRFDAKYCSAYCRLKAYRQRHGIHQRRADRDLRSALEGVSSGRLSGASAKARLGLYLVDGIKVDKDIRRIIENL